MSEHKTPFVRSTLTARSIPGQRKELMAAFFKHHVFEECKAAVPGFLSGEVLLSMADADELQISVLWSNQRAWQTWQDSPVRHQQVHALAHLLACAPQGQLYALATHGLEPGHEKVHDSL